MRMVPDQVSLKNKYEVEAKIQPPKQILMFDAFLIPLNHLKRSAKSKGQMRPAYSKWSISYLLGKNKSNYTGCFF